LSPSLPARRLRLCVARPPSAARASHGALEQALERLVESRADEARARGRAEGRAAALSEVGRAFEEALERLDAGRRDAEEQLARGAVELALGIAQHLLRSEIPAGRYDLERIVREALACSDTGRGACVVHVHPLDAERLSEVPFRAGTQIEPDHAVPRGSVHVTTPHGLLVRDLDLALRSIGERILERLR
jgi:flagellar biosynthesis/type III secretory pathway protein FliH